MKEVDTNQEPEKKLSLYEQAMKQKPLFASNAEALIATQTKLESLARKRGCSVFQLLNEAENSSRDDDDLLEARHLRMTIHALKRL